MHSRNFQDKATQTGEDEKALFIYTSKGELSPDQKNLLKKISKKNPHDTIDSYLEILRAKYREDLDSMYECVEELLDIISGHLYRKEYHEGLRKALLDRYVEMKAQDRESFILYQVLEEYYERSIKFPKSYTQEMLEEDYNYALSLALKVTDQPDFFSRIYQIDAKK